jgi:hypothetical protein
MSRARRSEPRRRAGKPARSSSYLAKRGFQGTVAVVGLLIALTQLVDWLERRGDPSPTLSAEFTAITLQQNQLLREFIRAQHRPPEPDERDALDQRGVAMRMRIRVQADPERTLLVRWTVYDPATNRPLPGPQWTEVVARVLARSDERERDVPCWIALPAKLERFYVRLTVETTDGRVLATERTRTLSTAAPQ